jgi:hypothetical protein
MLPYHMLQSGPHSHNDPTLHEWNFFYDEYFFVLYLYHQSSTDYKYTYVGSTK